MLLFYCCLADRAEINSSPRWLFYCCQCTCCGDYLEKVVVHRAIILLYLAAVAQQRVYMSQCMPLPSDFGLGNVLYTLDCTTKSTDRPCILKSYQSRHHSRLPAQSVETVCTRVCCYSSSLPQYSFVCVSHLPVRHSKDMTVVYVKFQESHKESQEQYWIFEPSSSRTRKYKDLGARRIVLTV
jgi:hypothetical protein